MRAVDLCDDVRDDSRKSKNGEPWRKCRVMHSLMEPEANKSRAFYEAQHSLAVFGCKESSWTSLCLADTYFYKHDPNNPDDIDYYIDYHIEEDDANSDSDGDSLMWDPSTIGILEANKVRTPYEYFLMVLSIRLEQLVEDWVETASALHKEFSAHVSRDI